MLRTADRKIVTGREGQTLQLFDLRNDPLEQTNLCGHPDHAQTELEMRSRLLSRLGRDTFRDTDMDPEYCQHTFPH